ncbi:MAG TPA: hypothetical protein VF186_10550 [Gaiellaceae bacterium]
MRGREAGALYDLVALGMRAYVGARFSVRVFGAERLRLDPGTLVVATHRSDDDAPLLCGTLYVAARLWRRRRERVAFAVRDDLFEPGFFAGYPKGVPLPVRRLVWPLSIGATLRDRLGCLPIRSATGMRLAQLLRGAPELPVERLPDDVREAVARRAARLGIEAPGRGGDLLEPRFSDLLWRVVDRDEVTAPELLDPVWRARAGAALDDLRGLVDLVRGGGRLLLFPEGRPSPDGAIGPLMPGFSTLVRRGRATRVQPVALAYDPLAPGRTRAYVSVGESFVPQLDSLDETILASLRRAMPLTAGQLAAEAALDGGTLPPRVVASAVERALAERRPVEPRLLDAGDRGRLAEAVFAARAAPARAARLRREAASAGVTS